MIKKKIIFCSKNSLNNTTNDESSVKTVFNRVLNKGDGVRINFINNT